MDGNDISGIAGFRKDMYRFTVELSKLRKAVAGEY